MNIEEIKQIEQELTQIKALYIETLELSKVDSSMLQEYRENLANLKNLIGECNNALIYQKSLLIENEINDITTLADTLLNSDDIDIDLAIVTYQNSAIAYAQQIDLCLLQQIARERLAYDLFLCIVDDSSISSKKKIMLENISSELVEMIPKVGEFMKIASDIQSGFIENKLKTSELNTRYKSVYTSIGLIDLYKEEQTNFKTSVEVYTS